jgi:hypothetical protein
MGDGIQEIITQLEQKQRAIDAALAALHGLGVSNTPQAATSSSAVRRKAAPAKKGGLTSAGRKRLAEAMKKRWAVKRAGSTVKRAARAARKSS